MKKWFLLSFLSLQLFGSNLPTIDQATEAILNSNDELNSNKADYLKDKSQPIPYAPKVLNFIWFGSDLPEIYKENILSWKKLNSDYQINIWSSALGMLNHEDLDLIDQFCQQNQLYFINIDNSNSLPNIEIVKNLLLEEYGWRYACASDVLRVSILLTQGGWYLDTDYKAIRSLGNLACPDGFLQFFKNDNYQSSYNNSIQAAIPHHPVYAMAAYILKKNSEIFFNKSKASSFWQRSRQKDEINDGVILSFGLAIQQALNYLVARKDLHQDVDISTRVNFSDYAVDSFDVSYQLKPLLKKNQYGIFSISYKRKLIKKDKIYISMDKNKSFFTYTVRDLNGVIKTGEIACSDLNIFSEYPSTIQELKMYTTNIIEIIAKRRHIRKPTNWRFGLTSGNKKGSLIPPLREALDEISKQYFLETPQHIEIIRDLDFFI